MDLRSHSTKSSNDDNTISHDSASCSSNVAHDRQRTERIPDNGVESDLKLYAALGMFILGLCIVPIFLTFIFI